MGLKCPSCARGPGPGRDAGFTRIPACPGLSGGQQRLARIHGPIAAYFAHPSERFVDEALALLAAEPQADSVRGVVPSGQNPTKCGVWILRADK